MGRDRHRARPAGESGRLRRPGRRDVRVHRLRGLRRHGRARRREAGQRAGGGDVYVCLPGQAVPRDGFGGREAGGRVRRGRGQRRRLRALLRGQHAGHGHHPGLRPGPGWAGPAQ